MRIKAGCFGIKGKQCGGAQLFQPSVEAGLIEDGFILRLDHFLDDLGDDLLAGSLGVALYLVDPALELHFGV
ncbi:hypothetical protein D3C77_747220 [compost metagenome]